MVFIGIGLLGFLTGTSFALDDKSFMLGAFLGVAWYSVLIEFCMDDEWWEMLGLLAVCIYTAAYNVYSQVQLDGLPVYIGLAYSLIYSGLLVLVIRVFNPKGSASEPNSGGIYEV